MANLAGYGTPPSTIARVIRDVQDQEEQRNIAAPSGQSPRDRRRRGGIDRLRRDQKPHARRADRVKLLVWDGSGLVLVWKWLETQALRWPPVTDGVMRLSAAQLAALLEGLDWSRVHVPRLGRPKAAGELHFHTVHVGGLSQCRAL